MRLRSCSRFALFCADSQSPTLANLSFVSSGQFHRCLPISPNPRVRVAVGVGLGLGLGSGLRHALRHDALSTSVSNNFIHVRRIGIRRNGAEPLFDHLCFKDSVKQKIICQITHVNF